MTAALPRTDRPVSEDDVDAATAYYARAREVERVTPAVALVFRIGAEWLAMPAAQLDRVADMRPVHSLPQRRGSTAAGLINLGGDVVVHVSLAGLLGIEADAVGRTRVDTASHRIVARLMVLIDSRGRIATTVDEVWGVHHYDESQLRAVPSTLTRALTSFTAAMLDVGGHSVGFLHAPRVMDGLSAALV